nr:hypothetical protein [Angustibacter aerolatus]
MTVITDDAPLGLVPDAGVLLQARLGGARPARGRPDVHRPARRTHRTTAQPLRRRGPGWSVVRDGCRLGKRCAPDVPARPGGAAATHRPRVRAAPRPRRRRRRGRRPGSCAVAPRRVGAGRRPASRRPRPAPPRPGDGRRGRARPRAGAAAGRAPRLGARGAGRPATALRGRVTRRACDSSLRRVSAALLAAAADPT